jgi:hypothetical protein
MAAECLSDSVFQEEHRGPLGGQGRDPSPEQIAERCRIIRRFVPRDPAGPSGRWSLPIVADKALLVSGGAVALSDRKNRSSRDE